MDLSRKLDQEGGGSKSGFPKIEGGRQHLARGKVNVNFRELHSFMHIVPAGVMLCFKK